MNHVSGVHAGSDMRVMMYGTADRAGTVETPYARRAVSAGSGRRRWGSMVPVEPRNGVPALALYEWRRGGRVTPLTARIMAEIGTEKEG